MPGQSSDACAVQRRRPLRAVRGRQRRPRGAQCACALWSWCWCLVGLGCSRGGRGHGAAGQAAQGAEIRPAAEVSQGSPSRAAGRRAPIASGLGLSERVARSGLSGLPPGRAARSSGSRPGAGGAPRGLDPPLRRGAPSRHAKCSSRYAVPASNGSPGRLLARLAPLRLLVFLNGGIRSTPSLPPRAAPSVRYCSKPALSNGNVVSLMRGTYVTIHFPILKRKTGEINFNTLFNPTYPEYYHFNT